MIPSTDSPQIFYIPQTMAEPAHDDLRSTLLRYRAPPSKNNRRRILVAAAAAICSLLVIFLVVGGAGGRHRSGGERRRFWSTGGAETVQSEIGVVAADDGLCSEVGAAALRRGGHAVDAAVATAVCLGVRHPMSSGIGGGAFMVVSTAAGGSGTVAEAFDSRETAPAAAAENMYEKNPSSKEKGALSMGIPGEVAGLHAAWSKYGRLPWKTLLAPAITLARDGFLVEPYLAYSIKNCKDDIMADPGLKSVFAPNGNLLQFNDTCYNPKLADTLEMIATEGPQALYNGSIGEKLIEDVRNAGGIATMEDMRKYKVEVGEAMKANAMGYTILGMPPPSSGTVGISLVLNVLGSYKTPDAAKGLLGLHRLIEALKHMLAIRMNLGDPDFVNITGYINNMLSPSFAEKIKQRIFDNTTFSPGYYLPRWSQLRDHGTSHLCVVDADRNAVSMTSTVNYYFGAGVLSPSTGIVLNNEMADFSTPTEATPDHLPPAPANFIKPNKRPLSSMTPLIILKDNQLAGIVGGSGGMNIIPAVSQAFLNHFILGMDPLKAVQHPRIYHKLIPNVVCYENWTAMDGEHIELATEARAFLEQRNHQLKSTSGVSAVVQFVVHNLQEPVSNKGGRGWGWMRPAMGDGVFRGMLTAVSDPRKDGRPAGV
ncbi:putative gamma-glutamyltranspeptidase 3 [Iris pallida]|uniref:Glutathione hydrolase n=1 Tax=Iris pallida TaxID=29817 RepID=A0AAX6IG52_IRIPA|nr:putative gamma-glutamyltranspeptidase 3 [Iris pallida]